MLPTAIKMKPIKSLQFLKFVVLKKRLIFNTMEPNNFNGEKQWIISKCMYINNTCIICQQIALVFAPGHMSTKVFEMAINK